MLELRLFGPPRVRLDGAELRFDTRKAVALLAVLAVTGREHGRESIAAMLWPELDRSRARAVLRRTLSVATSVGSALQITGGGVGLDADQVRCDVWEFRRLARADDPESWARAAELAAERFLEGFALRDSPAFEDWQIGVTDGLRDQLSQTLGRLVADAVTRGDLDAALAHARHRTRVDPLSEPAHTDVIRVTAWSGDRPGALSAYRALVRLLDAELGVPPLPATLALHEAIRGDRLQPPPRVDPPVPGPPAAESGPGSEPIESSPERLVGRDAAIARFDCAWRLAAGSEGRSVGLIGERGIGKSALLRVLGATVAAEGWPVLRIAGHAAEQPLAYAAAIDLVRAMLVARPHLVAELGSTGEPLAALATQFETEGAGAIRSPGDLLRVHEAVRAALEACAAGARLLMVIDDAHLLDAPSSALFAYLTRRLPAGVVTLTSWTSGTGGSALQDAVAEGGDVVSIGPLGPAEIAELVSDGLDPAEVLRRTRGVPLLVRELATTGGPADALATVRGVVAARYAAASNVTRQLVAAAAVIGTVADPELLRITSGRDEAEAVDAIEEAVARGLLVERADRPGYDLPHDLVRDVALAELSLARTRLLHGRVADALVRRHGVDPLVASAGAVAGHLAQAGRDEAAGAWYLAAADESARLFAHEEALSQLRTALALGQRNSDVHHAIGRTLVRLGRYGDALISLDQAVALAEGDGARQVEIEHVIAGVHDRLGDWSLAEAHLEAAAMLAKDRSLARSARILADLALVRHRQGSTALAKQAATAALLEAESAADQAALAQADNVLGVLAAAEGDRHAALAHLTRAVDRGRALDDLDLLIAALNNLSRMLQETGAEAAALESAREALTLAEHQGDRHRLAALHSHLADLLHAAGRGDEALAELRTSAVAFADIHGSASRPEVWTLTEW